VRFARVRVPSGGERRRERVRHVREKRFPERTGPDGPQEDDAPGEADEPVDESERVVVVIVTVMTIVTVCAGQLALRVLRRKLQIQNRIGESHEDALATRFERRQTQV